MKKIIVTLLIFSMLIVTSALADVDLSGMTYEELVALKDQIDFAIWNSDEWQEIEVPTGIYVVGEDIPSGRWSISIAESNKSVVVCVFTVYENPDDYYKSNGCLSNSFLDVGKIHNTSLIDGQLVEISGESVIFHPYNGASFGFK